MKRKIVNSIFMAMLIVINIKAQPPNNSIFFGSTGDGFNLDKNVSASNAIFAGSAGDGFSRVSNNVIANNIFLGGTGDGWNFAANTIVPNSIYFGGIGDGWANEKNVSLSNSIFIGGIGDGWNSSINISLSNNIFSGSIGDGWSNAFNVSTPNNIFLGGDGDGWSSVYRPVGPLPVSFISFNVQKQTGNRALIAWQTSFEVNSAWFEVQRSTDAIIFYSIGRVQAAGNSTSVLSYSFVDNQPAKGLNYYRLKQTDADNHFVLTPSRVLNFDDQQKGSVKYYPNPTMGILNIELTDDMRKENAVINISNATGIMMAQLKISPGTNNILPVNLAAFAKGIYFIQVKTSKENSVQRIVLQ
ncbi:MAG: T9SS type A sorting domain-containing protein [Ferruginibacter sp.]